MGEKSWKIGTILSKKMSRTQKIKNAKTGNLVFISIQPIPDLSCEFVNFGNFFLEILNKKIITFFFLFFFPWGA